MSETPTVDYGLTSSERVLLTSDGREVGLWDAEIVGDSVVGLGYAVGVPYEDARERPGKSQSSRRAVALRDVSRVMTRQVDGPSTGVVVALGTAVVALAVAFGIALSQLDIEY